MVSAPRGAEPGLVPRSAASASRFGRGDVLRIALALTAGIALVAGSPIVNTLRQSLLEAWPAGYVPVLAGVVAVTGLALVGFTLSRMRDRSWPQLSALSGAVAVAVGAGAALRTGVANVDAVEAFHFVEYSALTLLFAWAYGRVAGPQAWAWAACAVLLVGTMDEWTQWFVPGRTGEIRDVFINGISIGCGLLLARALDLGQGAGRVAAGWPLGIGAACVGLAVAGFFASAHLGHELDDVETGQFLSYRTQEELAALAQARAREWARRDPEAQARFSREDQYLSEALWHVRRRNQAMDDHDLAAAWRENRILEKYFAPVLSLRDAAGSPRHALAAEQVADLEPGRVAAGRGRSDANPLPIVTWRPARYWTAVLLAAAGLLLVSVRGAASARRHRREDGDA